jgi:hypothetical protein
MSFDDLHYTKKGLFGNRVGLDRLPNNGFLLLIAMMECGDQREGNLTILEINSDLLSKFLLVGSVIEIIINELEGDADIHPEIGYCPFLFFRYISQNGANLCGG